MLQYQVMEITYVLNGAPFGEPYYDSYIREDDAPTEETFVFDNSSLPEAYKVFKEYGQYRATIEKRRKGYCLRLEAFLDRVTFHQWEKPFQLEVHVKYTNKIPSYSQLYKYPNCEKVSRYIREHNLVPFNVVGK